MRILHTADWHLGKQLHHVSLINDQAIVLDQLHRVLKEYEIECLIISGDIFDRSVPSSEAVELFDETLSRLAFDYAKPVIIISGNHDSPPRLAFGSKLFSKLSLHVVTSIDYMSNLINLSDSYGMISVIALPFIEEALSKDISNTLDKPFSYEETIQELLRKLSSKIPAKSRTIVAAHAFIQGSIESESERPVSLGGTTACSAHIFEDFSYTALGHLHRAQSVQKSHIRYAGSILKYSSSEIPYKKTFSLVDIDASGKPIIEEIPIQPKRDFRELRGLFTDLCRKDFDNGDHDDYFSIIIDDQGPILDAMPRLQEIYPNVLEIHREAIDSIRHYSVVTKEFLKQDETSLFKNFALQCAGLKLNEMQLDILKQALATTLSRKEED
ncbi:MAG: exonuclease SbcCD subunit D [SAR324 cluster bacterium]|uniref:Nuclease SbcCD subunit D n=1 Tax=SAR324 cluster bacterium TaxID=2024889 RepID=A0A7X9FQI3_9DELT|nr:exonuclease SbcCD subunit D [SAR324 cluster bacterium]